MRSFKFFGTHIVSVAHLLATWTSPTWSRNPKRLLDKWRGAEWSESCRYTSTQQSSKQSSRHPLSLSAMAILTHTHHEETSTDCAQSLTKHIFDTSSHRCNLCTSNTSRKELKMSADPTYPANLTFQPSGKRYRLLMTKPSCFWKGYFLLPSHNWCVRKIIVLYIVILHEYFKFRRWIRWYCVTADWVV